MEWLWIVLAVVVVAILGALYARAKQRTAQPHSPGAAMPGPRSEYEGTDPNENRTAL